MAVDLRTMIPRGPRIFAASRGLARQQRSSTGEERRIVPVVVARNLRHSSRSFHTTTRSSGPLTWFSRARTAFWNVYFGDDHINPRKLLERKYLYVALLANHLRKLRLEQPETSKEELHERAIRELEQRDLDNTSNVDLRKELQNYLEPQVKTIFEAFHRVDERLKIRPSSTENEQDDVNLEESECKDILLNEYQQTKVQIQNLKGDTDEKSERSLAFFRRKQSAIETLLTFHGWSTETIERATKHGSSDCDDSLDDFAMDVSNTNETNLRLIRNYQTLNLCRSALIRQELGFSILCLRSNIPGAGRGVFLDGSALAGSVVCFQPGDVWPKEHLITDAPDVVEHFEGDNDLQISLRFDEYLVDTRQSPVTVLTRDGFLNPWALGHMINHPNPSTMPNCQSTMLNYTIGTQLGDELVRYIPNTYAREPTWRSKFFDLYKEDVIMHGLCLIARKDTSNEELLYDYRLQSEDTPDWYSIVEYGDGWEDDQIVFFRYVFGVPIKRMGIRNK